MKYQQLLKDNIDLFKPYVKPASAGEIENIEKDLNIIIPDSIKDFF